jgi:hypothetical protein
MPSAGGAHFYSGAPTPTRHLWLLSRHVRPHELEALPHQLAGIERVALMNELGVSEARFLDVVADVMGEPLASQWRTRIARVEHRHGWSLVTLRVDP